MTRRKAFVVCACAVAVTVGHVSAWVIDVLRERAARRRFDDAFDRAYSEYVLHSGVVVSRAEMRQVFADSGLPFVHSQKGVRSDAHGRP